MLESEPELGKILMYALCITTGTWRHRGGGGGGAFFFLVSSAVGHGHH